MKQILRTGGLIAGLAALDGVEVAIQQTTERVKNIADALEEIDNNLEVDKDEDIYL